MDAGATTAVSTMLTAFSGDAVDQLTAVIPIAATLVITVAVVFAAIKWFRAMIHA